MSLEEEPFEKEDDYQKIRRRTQEKQFDPTELLNALTENGRIALSDGDTSKVQRFVTYRMEVLRSVIHRLKEEMGARQRINQTIQGEIRYQMHRSQASLEQLQGGLGYNTGVDVKRNFLEKELSSLRKERRQSAVQCWQQLVAARKELREATKEYLALKQVLSRSDRGEASAD